MTEIKEQHETTDIGEAAYLKLAGFPVKFDRRDPRSIVFIFRADPTLLKRKALDYYEFRANVDAKSYHDTLKQLKKALGAAKTSL